MTTANDLNILLVEDDRLIALDARQALEEAGYTQLTVCHTADDAIFHATSNGLPDVALLDIDLGGGQRNGFDVTNVLNRLGEVLIIFWTAHPQEFRQHATMRHALFTEKNTSPEVLAHNIGLLARQFEESRTEAASHVFLSYRYQHSEIVSKVPVNDIIYLEADQRRVDFYTLHRAFKGIGRSLGEFEDSKLYLGFFRIHHKYILNVASPAVKGFAGHFVVVEVPVRQARPNGLEEQVLEARELPVSRRTQGAFREFWMNWR